MTSIIVLGYRKGLDEAIARRGLTPFFVVERVKSALANHRYVTVARLEDAQDVLRAVLAAEVGDVRAVVTGHEEAIFTAALLRAHFDTPDDRDHVRTLRFRDKYLQKRALPASVPRADCVYATPRSTFADLADRLGAPFVLKPANGFGAARTMVVSSADDVERFWSTGPTGSSVEAVAESYVGGDEVHLDGLWRGGRLVWSSLSEYVDPPLQWNDGGILADGVVSRQAEPGLYAEADALAWRALGALDAPDCVFHLEAYRGHDGQPHAGRLVFGECAIRLAGAMVPEVIRLTHGVDLYEVALALALGEDVDIHPNAPPEHYYGYVFLRRMPGVALTEDDFRRAFDLHELDFPTEADAPTGSYGRSGHAIVRHADSAALRELLADIVTFNVTGSVRPRVLEASRGAG